MTDQNPGFKMSVARNVALNCIAAALIGMTAVACDETSAPSDSALRPATTKDIVGTTWTPTVSRPVTDRKSTLEFRGGWIWSGSDGCNDVAGSYELGAEGAVAAESGPIALLPCRVPSAPTALIEATGLSMKGEHLVLVDAAGEELMELEPVG